MGNSIHFIFQIDTDALVSIYKETGQHPSDQQVLTCTTLWGPQLCCQGEPIKDEVLKVYQDQEVYFTLIPKNMQTTHKMFFGAFTGYNSNAPQRPIIKYVHHREVSFRVDPSLLKLSGKVTFALNGDLEFEAGQQSIPFAIDPKLQVSQGKG